MSTKITKDYITSQSASDGQVLTADGSGNVAFETPEVTVASMDSAIDDAISGVPTAGRLLAVYTLTGSGTFSRQNANTNTIRLRLQGAGGSGGGAAITTAGQYSVGAPGGPGAYVEALLVGSANFQGKSYSVGSGGAAAAAGSAGNNGGNTSFDTIVAGGGSGGVAGAAVSSVPGTLGGNPNSNATASGGYLNLAGHQTGADIQTSTSSCKNLNAAKPVLGDSARAAVTLTSAAGNPAPSGYGGAGTGGMNAASQAAAVAGGAGADGIIIVEEYA